MVNFTYFGEGGRRGLWEGPKSETETLILVISQVKAICGFHCLSLFIGFLSISTFKCLFKAFLHLFWIPLQCSSLHCSQGLFHHLFIIHHHLNHLHHGHNPFPHITMVMIIHHISHCNNHNNENSQRTFLTYPPPPTMYCSPTSLPATSLYASTDVPGHHDPHTQATSRCIFSFYRFLSILPAGLHFHQVRRQHLHQLRLRQRCRQCRLWVLHILWGLHHIQNVLDNWRQKKGIFRTE